MVSGFHGLNRDEGVAQMKRKLFIAFTLIVMFTFGEAVWARSTDDENNGEVESAVVVSAAVLNAGTGAAVGSSQKKRRRARRPLRRGRRGRRGKR